MSAMFSFNYECDSFISGPSTWLYSSVNVCDPSIRRLVHTALRHSTAHGVFRRSGNENRSLLYFGRIAVSLKFSTVPVQVHRFMHQKRTRENMKRKWFPTFARCLAELTITSALHFTVYDPPCFKTAYFFPTKSDIMWASNSTKICFLRNWQFTAHDMILVLAEIRVTVHCSRSLFAF